MIKKYIIILFLFIHLIIVTSGCLEQKNKGTTEIIDKRFLGSWINISLNLTITFDADGFVRYSTCDCERKWGIRNQTLFFYYPEYSGKKDALLYESSYSFSNDNQTLSLTNLYDLTTETYEKLLLP
ncbi:MAG: hypothetical protein QXX20_05870 [Candidatus Thermoplasmatota archaeon]